MEGPTGSTENESIHESVFTGPKIDLLKVLKRVIPSIAETHIRVHFTCDPLASLRESAQIGLSTLMNALAKQNPEDSLNKGLSQTIAMGQMQNILASMTNNMRTINDVSAYNVHWHVTLCNFMEVIPKQSLLMRSVMNDTCIFPLSGNLTQLWSSRPFKNHGVTVCSLPMDTLEATVTLKPSLDLVKPERIVVKLCDKTGKNVSKYYFEKTLDGVGQFHFVKEERQAKVCISYLEGVTSNVVLGLVGELNIPFTLDRKHQHLLDSREKVHVVVLAEYLGLNCTNNLSIHNECGIRIDFNEKYM